MMRRSFGVLLRRPAGVGGVIRAWGRGSRGRGRREHGSLSGGGVVLGVCALCVERTHGP